MSHNKTKEPNILDKQIKEQLDFVAWLTKHGLYNPLESSLTMQKMHSVWKIALNK